MADNQIVVFLFCKELGIAIFGCRTFPFVGSVRLLGFGLDEERGNFFGSWTRPKRYTKPSSCTQIDIGKRLEYDSTAHIAVEYGVGFLDIVGIVALAAFHVIVARTAFKRIVAFCAEQIILQLISFQIIVSSRTETDIVVAQISQIFSVNVE